MAIESENGELMEGISIPENTTYSQSENLKSLLKYLKEKEENYIQSLIEEKNEKEKIKKDIDFIKSRIKLVSKRLNSSSKKTSKNVQKDFDEKINLIIKIIDDETIFINDTKCDFENIESRIIELIKDLSPKEKENLNPAIVFNSPDGDSTLETVKNILRKHHVLHINRKPATFNINSETNVIKFETSKKKDNLQQKQHKKKLMNTMN